MLASAVGAVGYVIRKLNQVRENLSPSQSRFEAIEIIEALILAMVAVATAWSGYQAAQWAGKRAQQYAEASRLRVTAEGPCHPGRTGADLRERYFQQLGYREARRQGEGGGVLRAAL